MVCIYNDCGYRRKCNIRDTAEYCIIFRKYCYLLGIKIESGPDIHKREEVVASQGQNNK